MAGVSAYLKEVQPDIVCMLADPHSSSLFSFVKSGGRSCEASEGSTVMEGIGINRITSNFSEAKVWFAGMKQTDVILHILIQFLENVW